MANKKALMYDADTYTPVDSQFFRWDSSSESVQPTAPPSLTGYTGIHTGTAAALAGSFAGGTNKSYAMSGHIQVTILTPGTGSNYVAGDTATWHLDGVIIRHGTGGSYTTWPDIWNTGKAPTYDLSTSNNHFSSATIDIDAAGGTVYLNYTPEVGATSTVATTVVKIASQLIITELTFV
jgi:hypothetical protein